METVQEHPLITKLKQDLMAQVRNFNMDALQKNVDKNDTITLYHGTSTYYLNYILENGIQPRNITGNNNWRSELAYSNENIVYLTNKWHYWYAYNATEMLLENKYGENWSSIPEAQWWLTGNPLPIYIECKVPKALLTLDEDILYAKIVKDKIKKAIKNQSDIELNLTWQDCLAHHGTVGVRGGIPKEFITSFTILGDGKFYLDLMDERATYKKEMTKWFEGKGKGTLKLDDLKKMEQRYKYNGIIQTRQIPDGYKVSEVYYNPEAQSMGITLNTPMEYLQQPRKLEII